MADISEARKLHLLQRSLRANQTFGFVYLNNPKVGCSTIKGALWAELAGITPERKKLHTVEGSPFENDPVKLGWAKNAFVFSVVRNPFTRVVSAYLNKIRTRTDNTWERFARRHALDENKLLSFNHFVELVTKDRPEQADGHWGPQVLGLSHPAIVPNFIGQLERMDEDFGFIFNKIFPDRDVPKIERSKNATGATDIFSDFLTDPDTLARVKAYYAPDFAVYGYPDDFNQGLVSRITPEYAAHSHPAFAGWVTEFEGTPVKTGEARAKKPGDKSQRPADKVKRAGDKTKLGKKVKPTGEPAKQSEDKVKRLAEKAARQAEKAKRLGE